MSGILKALIFLFLVQTVAVVADKGVKETDDSTEMLASLFEQFDHDKDGLLSLEEVSESMKADGIANAYAIGKLFKTADADADGKISRVEAPTLSELLDKGTEKGEALSLLAEEKDNSTADEDQGSSEEREELENQKELAELQKMWKEADTDKDGHLSFTEVKGAMEKSPGKFLNLDEDEMIGFSSLGYDGAASVCEKAFKVSDQDKDGKLSNDEMLEFMDQVDGLSYSLGPGGSPVAQVLSMSAEASNLEGTDSTAKETSSQLAVVKGRNTNHTESMGSMTSYSFSTCVDACAACCNQAPDTFDPTLRKCVCRQDQDGSTGNVDPTPWIWDLVDINVTGGHGTDAHGATLCTGAPPLCP